MSKKLSIYQSSQLEAMSDILSQTDIYFFRKVCRWYSEKFHTPLHVVTEGKVVQWDEVLLHYYECQMEEIGYNHIYELACQEYIPELVEQFEEDNAAFAKALEEEQARTIEANKHKLSSKIHKTQEKLDKVSSKVPKEEKPAPKSMNLSFDEEDYEE